MSTNASDRPNGFPSTATAPRDRRTAQGSSGRVPNSVVPPPRQGAPSSNSQHQGSSRSATVVNDSAGAGSSRGSNGYGASGGDGRGAAPQLSIHPIGAYARTHVWKKKGTYCLAIPPKFIATDNQISNSPEFEAWLDARINGLERNGMMVDNNAPDAVGTM